MTNAADVLTAILHARENGEDPLLILAEDSPLMDAARDVLKPQSPHQLSKLSSLDDTIGKFLYWKLPKDFDPDGGVSFVPSPTFSGDHLWPTGTNLFTAKQAQEMLEHAVGNTIKQYEESIERLCSDIAHWKQNAYNADDALAIEQSLVRIKNDDIVRLKAENAQLRIQELEALVSSQGIEIMEHLDTIAALRDQLARMPVWVSPSDRLPDVKKGDYAQFNVACLRARTGKIYVFAAEYLNETRLLVEDGSDDDDDMDDGCAPFTGWYIQTKNDPDYDTSFEAVCSEGDEIIAWQPLPIYIDRPGTASPQPDGLAQDKIP